MKYFRFAFLFRVLAFWVLSLGLAGSVLAVKSEKGFPRFEYFAPGDYGGHWQVFQSVQDA